MKWNQTFRLVLDHFEPNYLTPINSKPFKIPPGASPGRFLQLAECKLSRTKTAPGTVVLSVSVAGLNGCVSNGFSWNKNNLVSENGCVHRKFQLQHLEPEQLVWFSFETNANEKMVKGKTKQLKQKHFKQQKQLERSGIFSRLLDGIKPAFGRLPGNTPLEPEGKTFQVLAGRQRPGRPRWHDY